MKKNSFIRLLSAMLCIFTVAALFAACTGGGDGKTPNEKYVVTFVTNGGSAIAAKESQSKKTLMELLNGETSSLEGKVLEGWYKDEALTQEFSLQSVINSDLTLYAKWRDPYVYERLEQAAFKTKEEVRYAHENSVGQQSLTLALAYENGKIKSGYADNDGKERFVFENYFYYERNNSKRKTPAANEMSAAAFLYDDEKFEDRSFFQTFAPVALSAMSNDSDFVFTADENDENKIRVTYTGINMNMLDIPFADDKIDLRFHYGKTFDFVLENGRIVSLKQHGGEGQREIAFSYGEETPAVPAPENPQAYDTEYQASVYEPYADGFMNHGSEFYMDVSERDVIGILGARWGYDISIYLDDTMQTPAQFDSDGFLSLTAHTAFYCKVQKASGVNALVWRALDKGGYSNSVDIKEYDTNGTLTGREAEVWFSDQEQAANGKIMMMKYLNLVSLRPIADATEIWYIYAPSAPDTVYDYYYGGASGNYKKENDGSSLSAARKINYKTFLGKTFALQNGKYVCSFDDDRGNSIVISLTIDEEEQIVKSEYNFSGSSVFKLVTDHYNVAKPDLIPALPQGSDSWEIRG